MKYAILLVLHLLFLPLLTVGQTDTAAIPVPEEESVKIMEASAWGGISLPYLPLDFRQNWKSGWNAGLSYGYSLEPGSIGYGTVSISAEYARMKRDYEKHDSATGAAQAGNFSWGGAVRAVNILLNFRGTFAKDTKSIGPYVQVGIGYANVTQEEITATPDTSWSVVQDAKSAVSWSFGAGIDVPFGDHAVFFAQAKSVIAVLDPVRQYFPISAGVRYRW